MLYCMSPTFFIFFYFGNTTCHSAFYKVLSFSYPAITVFIFTKIQLTHALPMPGPPPNYLWSVPQTQAVPIMCQQQNSNSSLADIFVQTETPAAPINQLLTFQCGADVCFHVKNC